MVRETMVGYRARLAWGRLSERQQRVLSWRARGRSYADIGRELGMSKQGACSLERTALKVLCAGERKAADVVALTRLDHEAVVTDFDCQCSGRCRKATRADRLEREMEALHDAFVAGAVHRKVATRDGERLERELLGC